LMILLKYSNTTLIIICFGKMEQTFCQSVFCLRAIWDQIKKTSRCNLCLSMLC